ncbi:hypothetical protein K7472_24895 [Streptomyces sp. PTM05]|uniref:Uncharacterized protein n=1 Tax=Streptantibioticus parmotrematis TaxID=2873249 RepID=A0ABS7QXX0_9ACTN|nr:hypothetical protein [Streptantibioticus parmotrematis]MBY8888053.1 hypothetical protein [Streptantibioticus parmotrematis]
MSVFRSRTAEQPAAPSAVERLQAEAADDYRRHHSPQTQAAAREQRGQAQVDGNAAAGTWHRH